MEVEHAYRIVKSDKLAAEQFLRWHDLLISAAQSKDGEYLVPTCGFRIAFRTDNGLAVPDCDLCWGLETEGRTVQINPAASAGDANVLSAIGENRQRPGHYAVLRQGRLQANRDSSRVIKGGEFRHAFQKRPVSAIGAIGPRDREWFLVCELSDDPSEVARQTGEFVERCAAVRAKIGNSSRSPG